MLPALCREKQPRHRRTNQKEAQRTVQSDAQPRHQKRMDLFQLVSVPLSLRTIHTNCNHHCQAIVFIAPKSQVKRSSSWLIRAHDPRKLRSSWWRAIPSPRLVLGRYRHGHRWRQGRQSQTCRIFSIEALSVDVSMTMIMTFLTCTVKPCDAQLLMTRKCNVNDKMRLLYAC